MSDKRSIRNVSTDPLAMVIMLVLVAVGFAVYFLVRGLINESPAAFAIAGGLATLALFLLGTVWLLAVQAIGRKHERGREQAAQETFVLNAKENMALLISTQRAQGLQNATLLKQQTAQQKLLSAGNGESLDTDFLRIDDSVFDELDG